MLSLVTGRPFVIEKIRAGRKKPGLLQQHLTAVLAAANVGGAEVEGAALGSRRLVFRPGQVRSGDYGFRVGTAGSATLVLQTVLPALLLVEGESNLVLEGGTHNPMAPPVDFLEKAYLPLVNRPGPRVEVQLVRSGFYPAGGGKFTVHVQPAKQLGRLELVDRGQITARRVRAMVANLPRHITERACRTIAQQPGWDEALFTIDEVKGSRGPGNVVMIELEAEHVTEVFTAFGQLGVRAEDVAKRALRQAEKYLVCIDLQPYCNPCQSSVKRLFPALTPNSHLFPRAGPKVGTGRPTRRSLRPAPRDRLAAGQPVWPCGR